MRTCVYCDKSLPESTHKGGRRQDYCNPACKNRYYRMRKQMKRDTEKLSDTYWKEAYKELVKEYKKLEKELQTEKEWHKIEDEKRKTWNERDMEYMRVMEDSMEYHRKRYERMQISCAAKLKHMGMSEKDIVEFNTYWTETMSNIYYAYHD